MPGFCQEPAQTPPLIETTVERRVVYDGKIIRVRCDRALDAYGKPIVREVVEHPGGVGVLAADGEGNVLLVRQYRYGVGEAVLEIPAGKLEPGEEPLACGKRELEEETGHVATDWQSLGVMLPTPAYCAERIWMYLATGLTETARHWDDNECMELTRVPLAEAARMVTDGIITDGKTQAAVLKAARLLGAEGGGGEQR